MLNRAARAKYKITALLAGMVLLHAVFFWHARHLIARRYPDFTAFYAAGLMVRSGMGHQLYDLTLQEQVERETVARPSGLPPLPFLRPAYEALAFAPFTLMSYLQAFTAWNLACLLLLGVWIRLARNNLASLKIFSPALWWLALFGFFPVFLNLPMGQDSIPLLLLMTLAFFKLRSGAPFGAGAWLGLAVFKPQIVLPLLLILLLFRPQRARLLSGFLLASLAVFLISAGVSGWHSMLHYPQYLLNVNRELGKGTITPSDMPNLRGLVAMLPTTRMTESLLGAASLLLMVLAGKLWPGQALGKTEDEFDINSAFSVSVLVALLVAYHTHVYDLALLILPIALRLNDLANAGDLRSHGIEVGTIALLFFTPLYLGLIRSGFANLLAPLLLLFAISIVASGGSRTRASISPSIGM
jgi:hypothetical protein